MASAKVATLRSAAAQSGYALLTPATGAANSPYAEHETYDLQGWLAELGVRPGCGLLDVPASARFFHIEAVLHRSAFAGCFRKVLLLDSRDSYFQADPFRHVTQPGLYPTQEQLPPGSKRDGWEYPWDPYNARWLRFIAERVMGIGAGATILSRITARWGERLPNLNSGATLGTTPAVLAYLRGMRQLLLQVGIGGVQYTGLGIDQGVHNYLLYVAAQDRLAGVNISKLSNEEGPIFHNVCWERSWGPHRRSGLPARHREVHASPLHATDPLFELRNGHRTMLAAVVHQWDRCWYLQEHVKAYLNKGTGQIVHGSTSKPVGGARPGKPTAVGRPVATPAPTAGSKRRRSITHLG